MTAQAAEVLMHKGEHLSLCSEPLGEFLKTIHSPIKFYAPSTALWRGYIGTWAIEGGHLYLVKLKAFVQNGEDVEDVGLSYLFPDYPDGVFAHWYSGELRCPMGEMLNYVHGGYASTYEQDLFIEVKNGVVLGERIVSNGTGTGQGEEGYKIAAMTTFGRG